MTARKSRIYPFGFPQKFRIKCFGTDCDASVTVSQKIKTPKTPKSSLHELWTVKR
jgi:hypothetical protein